MPSTVRRPTLNFVWPRKRYLLLELTEKFENLLFDILASRIKHVVKPLNFASRRNCSLLDKTKKNRNRIIGNKHITYKSSSESHLQIIFACPPKNHVSTASGIFSHAFWKHASVAWEHYIKNNIILFLIVLFF